MTTLDTMFGHGASHADTTGASRAMTPMTRVMHAALKQFRYRRTLRELQALDERTLKDIGLSRSDIVRVARTTSGYPAA